MMKKRFTPKTKQTKPLKPTACTVNNVNLKNRKQSVLFTQLISWKTNKHIRLGLVTRGRFFYGNCLTLNFDSQS